MADILCCKPSELAFYPLPKLMIRRVGDHEAHSATRAVRWLAFLFVAMCHPLGNIADIAIFSHLNPNGPYMIVV